MPEEDSVTVKSYPKVAGAQFEFENPHCIAAAVDPRLTPARDLDP
jgi:hypothetical protein